MMNESPDTYQLHHAWARLIHLGSLISLVRCSMCALLIKPEDTLQVETITTSFNSFLGCAMDLLSHNIVQDLKQLGSRVVAALCSPEKITLKICQDFCQTANMIMTDLMGRGSGNFLLLGSLLLNSSAIIYKNNPRLFLNGMWMTLNLDGLPVYDCEKLYHVINSWCHNYGVDLDDEVLQVIKTLSLKF